MMMLTVAISSVEGGDPKASMRACADCAGRRACARGEQGEGGRCLAERAATAVDGPQRQRRAQCPEDGRRQPLPWARRPQRPRRSRQWTERSAARTLPTGASGHEAAKLAETAASAVTSRHSARCIALRWVGRMW